MWKSTKTLALEEIQHRISRSSTFTEPLQPADDLKDFLSHFYQSIYEDATHQRHQQLLLDYPVLQQQRTALVPDTVSYEDFWQRYEYRCDLERVQDYIKAHSSANSTSLWKKAKEGIEASLPAGVASAITSSLNPEEEPAAANKREEALETVQLTPFAFSKKAISKPTSEETSTKTTAKQETLDPVFESKQAVSNTVASKAAGMLDKVPSKQDAVKEKVVSTIKTDLATTAKSVEAQATKKDDVVDKPEPSKTKSFFKTVSKEPAKKSTTKEEAKKELPVKEKASSNTLEKQDTDSTPSAEETTPTGEISDMSDDLDEPEKPKSKAKKALSKLRSVLKKRKKKVTIQEPVPKQVIQPREAVIEGAPKVEEEPKGEETPEPIQEAKTTSCSGSLIIIQILLLLVALVLGFCFRQGMPGVCGPVPAWGISNVTVEYTSPWWLPIPELTCPDYPVVTLSTKASKRGMSVIMRNEQNKIIFKERDVLELYVDEGELTVRKRKRDGKVPLPWVVG